MTDLDKKIEKLYFSIKEVSEITELESYVLRYWQSQFKQLKPRSNNAGVRRYSREDIDIVFKIKELLYEKKYTIKGAQEFLETKNNQVEKTLEQIPIMTINTDLLRKINDSLFKIIEKLD